MMTQNIIEEYLKVLNIQEVKHLDDITHLIQQHEKHFVFSSLKVLLKKEISLELSDIYESLVVQKQGGYCFEHNKLLYEVLKYLGFGVTFYLARVINNSDIEVPQTHRFTLLKYDNKEYLIDVGIGFRSPNVPILFDIEPTYSHWGILYRIKTLNKRYYSLELWEKQKWFRVTKFDLHPCYEADFEMGHFYSHQHPCAVFVNNLVVAKVTKEKIYSLRNKDYFHLTAQGEVRVAIKDEQHFSRIIQEDFNLQFSHEEMVYLFKTYVQE